GIRDRTVTGVQTCALPISCIVWDRTKETVRGRAGAQRLAVTNPGTIPDRGLYTVNLLDDGRRVGELDEEMVFETRPGENFVLGRSEEGRVGRRGGLRGAVV